MKQRELVRDNCNFVPTRTFDVVNLSISQNSGRTSRRVALNAVTLDDEEQKAKRLNSKLPTLHAIADRKQRVIQIGAFEHADPPSGDWNSKGHSER